MKTDNLFWEMVVHNHLPWFLGSLFLGLVLVFIAVLVDLWDGVITAKATGERIHSHKMRKTFDKMTTYFRIVILAFMADCIAFTVCLSNVIHFQYIIPFLALVACAVSIYMEGKSMFEHIRKRKSSAAYMPTIITDVIKATTKKEAREAIIAVLEAFTADKENERITADSLDLENLNK